MRVSFGAAIMVAFATVGTVNARSYVPLGLSDSGRDLSGSVHHPVKPEARPFLPGIAPADLELIEDALRRKRPVAIGDSRDKAHEAIQRVLGDDRGRAQLKGHFAEALFLERNPNWGYVGSPTASQHDLYTRVLGRQAPFTAQVKVHQEATPAVYARDMVADHRSTIFVVPDDHVEALRGRWRNSINALEATGLGSGVEAAEARRQLARVRGLGSTSSELDERFSRVARHVIRERNASYVSLGAGLALAIGPDLFAFLRSGSLEGDANVRIARALTLVASERGAAWTVGRIQAGALRGSLRGNVFIGSVILATDVGFTIFEHGGRSALGNVDFYTRLGGAVSGLALGMTAGSAVAIHATGLFGPAAGVGAGLAAVLVAGTVGHIGGEVITRELMAILVPELLRADENRAFCEARQQIAVSIQHQRPTIGTDVETQESKAVTGTSLLADCLALAKSKK